ncbi:MAG: TIGR03087 family PEP-CTERM/XrtA system glycosyltransferase [Acidiphilium sp.]|nr:TIGR03087 family PEP-CTERM/XrtA system glycosyltransferase [Acidiphilium sp.]MDD4935323.1 TIGR03087 family PEP-CTERM/XrtA system glycosyltransferase [Acidiphilium sp.]
MRDLLYLCHRIPYPPDKGDKIRAYHMIEHLRARFRVHLGCFIDDPADAVHIPALRARVASLGCIRLDPWHARLRALLRCRPGAPLVTGYFNDDRLAAWVRKTVQDHDITQVIAYSAAMAPYAEIAGIPSRILDMVDIDSEKFAAYGRTSAWPKRIVWAREGRTLLAFERAAVPRFDRTLFVSQAERDRFSTLAPESTSRTMAIGNGVDLAYFAPSAGFARPFPSGRPVILFTGAMDYRPNIEAVLWFATTVMPQLQAQNPLFVIVGSNPAPAVRALERAGAVQVTGRVPDTRPYLAHADLVVAPLLLGRGVQNKVLEAMAMARPVLASPAAFTGIIAEAGRDLLVAEAAADWARLSATVLAGCHPTMGEAARTAVLRHHSWAQTLAPLDALLGLAPEPLHHAEQVSA